MKLNVNQSRHCELHHCIARCLETILAILLQKFNRPFASQNDWFNIIDLDHLPLRLRRRLQLAQISCGCVWFYIGRPVISSTFLLPVNIYTKNNETNTVTHKNTSIEVETGADNRRLCKTDLTESHLKKPSILSTPPNYLLPWLYSGISLSIKIDFFKLNYMQK